MRHRNVRICQAKVYASKKLPWKFINRKTKLTFIFKIVFHLIPQLNVLFSIKICSKFTFQFHVNRSKWKLVIVFIVYSVENLKIGIENFKATKNGLWIWIPTTVVLQFTIIFVVLSGNMKISWVIWLSDFKFNMKSFTANQVQQVSPWTTLRRWKILCKCWQNKPNCEFLI